MSETGTKVHPSVEYDSSLIDSIATSLDLRKPNKEALDRVASELSASDGVPFTAVCDLATAVGKTYLAAGLIDYLALADPGIRNFLFVVPNKTIFTKTIDNFTAGTKRSLLGAMTTEPKVIHPGNFNASWVAAAMDDDSQVKLYVFNIQQLIAPSGKNEGRKVRDGENENLGISLYEALKEQTDLIVLSDEHHMYAEKAVSFSAAINDLDAMAVIGLTATPAESQTEDVIYHYPLARAIADQLVKTPCIVGRTDDRSDTEVRLQDALVLLNAKKSHADAYAAATGTHSVNPVMLVVARTIDEADEVAERLRQPDMLNSDDAVLVIHSDTSDENLEKLAAVEEPTSPVRAIVSVQMLGVGWDVKNVYVIVSLRPSVSEALTEQTLGRGLRLPWGAYTGNEMLDTVEVLAHEQYKKLLAETDKILEGLVSEGTVKQDRAEQARKRAEAKRAAQDYDKDQAARAAAEAAQAAAAAAGAATEDGGTESSSPEDTTGETMPGERATGESEPVDEGSPTRSELVEGTDEHGNPVINDTAFIQEAESRKKDATDEADNIDHHKVIAARTDVSVEVPVVVGTLKPKTLVLSKLNSEPFEDLGRRVAAGEKAQLLREILGVEIDEEDQAHSAPRPAEKIDASQLSLPPGSVLTELTNSVLYSDFVPSTTGNTGGAKRIAQAVIDGAGDEDALAPDLDMVKRMVNQVITRAAEDIEPEYNYDVSSQPFKKTKGNYRPVSTNRHELFKKSNAYSGWTRSLYPIVWFDSGTERDVANILEGDDSVEVWVRLERGDTPIPWDGGMYQPDFLVRLKNGSCFMVEAKADKDLDTKSVQGKKKAAETWVNLVSDYGFGKWKYLLVPESTVKSSSTWSHLFRGQRRT